MEKPQLVLEYLKIFIWPIMIIVVILVFKDPIVSVLGSGDIEIELFGVKLKGSRANLAQVEELQTKADELQENLKLVKKDIGKLENIKNGLETENQELKTKLDIFLLEQEKAGKNVAAKREVLSRAEDRAKEAAAANNALFRDIKQRVAQSQKIVNESKYEKASRHESKGFDNLINDRFRQSLEEFQNAFEAYPEYHNVEEISQLLDNNIADLENDQRRDSAKIRVYRQIVDKFAWGMPDGIKIAMQKFLTVNDPEYIANLFQGSERTAASDKIVQLSAEDPEAAVDSLIKAILPPSDDPSYRVNLNIARTLALMKPNWSATKAQYDSFRGLAKSDHYRDDAFKKWADLALAKIPLLVIKLETLKLEKGGDIFSGGSDVFFQIKINDKLQNDLKGFPTRENNLNLAAKKTHRLNNLEIRTPVLKDRDFWPVGLSIRVLDNDPSKSTVEMPALFELSIDKNMVGKTNKLISTDQDDKFPVKNGEMSVKIGLEQKTGQ
jgi:hypothetical protein